MRSRAQCGCVTGEVKAPLQLAAHARQTGVQQRVVDGVSTRVEFKAGEECGACHGGLQNVTHRFAGAGRHAQHGAAIVQPETPIATWMKP